MSYERLTLDTYRNTFNVYGKYLIIIYLQKQNFKELRKIKQRTLPMEEKEKKKEN